MMMMMIIFIGLLKDTRLGICGGTYEPQKLPQWLVGIFHNLATICALIWPTKESNFLWNNKGENMPQGFLGQGFLTQLLATNIAAHHFYLFAFATSWKPLKGILWGIFIYFLRFFFFGWPSHNAKTELCLPTKLKCEISKVELFLADMINCWPGALGERGLKDHSTFYLCQFVSPDFGLMPPAWLWPIKWKQIKWNFVFFWVDYTWNHKPSFILVNYNWVIYINWLNFKGELLIKQERKLTSASRKDIWILGKFHPDSFKTERCGTWRLVAVLLTMQGLFHLLSKS